MAIDLLDAAGISPTKTGNAGVVDVLDAAGIQKQPSKPSIGRGLGLDARHLIQGATGLAGLVADIPGGAYNAAANAVQGYHAPSSDKNAPFRMHRFGEGVSAILDKAGLPNDETPTERIFGAINEGIGGAGSGLGIAKGIQGAASPALQATGRTMAANPGKQLTGGATGGLAAGGAREAGLPVPVQMAAGVAGGMVPFAPRMATNMANGGLSSAERRVAEGGYVLPPATTEGPSTFSRLLGGWSGKVKSQQGASVKNQVLTNQIAASELGLPRDVELTPETFKTVRRNAAAAYGDVSRAAPVTKMDEPFINDLIKIESRNSQVADYFPELSDNKEVTNVVNSLSKHTEVPTPVLMDTIRTLREDATKNLQAIGSADKANLGFAQRSASNALESLIDRNLTVGGNTEAISKFREARQLIAKSHDIESATNPATGEVGAARFGALMKRGKPLSGGLAKIAEAANTIPKATQMPSKFGGMEPLSVLDILGSAGSIAAGHPELGLTLLGRPLARTLTLSPAYQRAMQNRAPMGAAGILPAQAAIQSNILRGNQ